MSNQDQAKEAAFESSTPSYELPSVTLIGKLCKTLAWLMFAAVFYFLFKNQGVHCAALLGAGVTFWWMGAVIDLLFRILRNAAFVSIQAENILTQQAEAAQSSQKPTAPETPTKPSHTPELPPGLDKAQ